MYSFWEETSIEQVHYGRKQLSGAKGAAGKMARRTGPSKKEVIGYGTAAGTGLLASSQIKKRRKKGEK